MVWSPLLGVTYVHVPFPICRGCGIPSSWSLPSVDPLDCKASFKGDFQNRFKTPAPIVGNHLFLGHGACACVCWVCEEDDINLSLRWFLEVALSQRECGILVFWSRKSVLGFTSSLYQIMHVSSQPGTCSPRVALFLFSFLGLFFFFLLEVSCFLFCWGFCFSLNLGWGGGEEVSE